MFAKVENGAVAYTTPQLPDVTERTSGFPHLPVAEQVKQGYYPLVEIKPAFDPLSEKLSDTFYDAIESTQVSRVYTVVNLTPEEIEAKVEHARGIRHAYLEGQYAAAITNPIDYMGTTFQADEYSQRLLASVIAAAGGVLPPGFMWFSRENVGVEMTFAQLQGLAQTILMRGQPFFYHKQLKKAAVRAAPTVAAVEAIMWVDV